MSELLPRVTAVRHVRDYVLHLVFEDGTAGDLDLRGYVMSGGTMVEPLKDVSFFKQVTLDRDSGSMLWPNDLNMCPDVLYHDVTGATLPGTPARQPAR